MTPLVGMYATPAPVRPQGFTNYCPPPVDVMGRLKNHAAIEVQVRVDWELAGPEWLEGVAVRWWQRHVYVQLDDRRIRTTGVWVHAGDVARTPGESSPSMHPMSTGSAID